MGQLVDNKTLTSLKVYPEGAEKVVKLQEAMSSACVTAEGKSAISMAAKTRRGRLMELLDLSPCILPYRMRGKLF